MIEGVGFLEIEKAARIMCDRNKAYLDTCCTNHTCFASEHLTDIHVTGVVLKQHCNAGTNTMAKADFWRNIKFWLNENGIANLISAPQLELDGYKLEYKSDGGWLVHDVHREAEEVSPQQQHVLTTALSEMMFYHSSELDRKVGSVP
eukprot:CCRYP_018674-RA/>CCRYP_018674-RA protein AED:0.59 eAED:0.44 QI:0/0/0/0.5/0/0/2/0/146